MDSKTGEAVQVTARVVQNAEVGLDDVEYHYACLECEEERGYHSGPDCDHRHHPRVAITMDIAKHLVETNHITLQPVREGLLNIREERRLSIAALSHSKKWGEVVRRDWKNLIMSGEILAVK